MRALLAVFVTLFVILPAAAGTLAPREGWVVIDTKLGFAALVDKLEKAVSANKMAAVTTASASAGAKAQGFTIPGNRVVGVFRNDFARRMLTASVASGIEAPIRFYLTENPDNTATLSYRKPSSVFAPYMTEGGAELKTLAGELDGIFAKIAEDATKDK
ncbi:MAG: DUF302 domain-containing protein [Proteobacteria bacterium]|nr:DUF302 domain-containing protein [Pseudomonadota bacterium]